MIPMNVWVVEDDTVYRRTLQRVLNREDNISCDRVFASCQPLLDAIKTEAHPDLVLMDLGLPGIGGVEGISKLAELAPELAVVVLTVFADKEKVLEALDAGAAGYLLKSSPAQDIVSGLREVFLGGGSLSPAVAKTVIEERRKPKPVDQFDLSDREVEILGMIAQDLSRKEIAEKLNITYRTVTFHLTNIYEKLGVNSQTGALAKAYQTGIL